MERHSQNKQRLVSIPHFFVFYFLTKRQKRYRSKKFKTRSAVILKTTGGSKISKCYDVTGKKQNKKKWGRAFTCWDPCEAGWECSKKAYQARAKPWVTSPSLFSLVTIIIFFRLREGECVWCGVREYRDTPRPWHRLGVTESGKGLVLAFHPPSQLMGAWKKTKCGVGGGEAGLPSKENRNQRARPPEPLGPPNELSSRKRLMRAIERSRLKSSMDQFITLYGQIMCVSHVCPLCPVTNWSNRYKVTKTLNTFPLRDSIHVCIRRLDRWRLTAALYLLNKLTFFPLIPSRLICINLYSGVIELLSYWFHHSSKLSWRRNWAELIVKTPRESIHSEPWICVQLQVNLLRLVLSCLVLLPYNCSCFLLLDVPRQRHRSIKMTYI